MELFNFDLSKWKSEQINYFKKYMNTFEKGSREYNIILKGITELEQSLKKPR